MNTCWVACHLKAQEVGSISKIFYFELLVQQICNVDNFLSIIYSEYNIIHIHKKSSDVSAFIFKNRELSAVDKI